MNSQYVTRKELLISPCLKQLITQRPFDRNPQKPDYPPSRNYLQVYYYSCKLNGTFRVLLHASTILFISFGIC